MDKYMPTVRKMNLFFAGATTVLAVQSGFTIFNTILIVVLIITGAVDECSNNNN